MESILNSPLLQTILCLVLIYAFLSLVVSNITEVINSYLKERSKLLYKSISALFNDGINVNFGQLLYNHPTIDKLKKDRCNLPQYISSAMFSNAIIDVIGNYARNYSFDNEVQAIVMDDSGTDIFGRFKNGVQKMKHTELKLFLLNLVDKCESYVENKNTIVSKVEALDTMLQKWYNDHMDRVSGWYKDKIRKKLFWIAFFFSILLNVDSIHLFQTLYRSPALRAQLQPIADNLASNYASLQHDTTLTALEKTYRAAALTQLPKDSVKGDSATKVLSRIILQLRQIDTVIKTSDTNRTAMLKRTSNELDQINSFGIPLGWHKDVPPLSWKNKPDYAASTYMDKYKNRTGWNIVSYLLGILLSAFALSVGAPFWFTVLLKFVNIRRAGAKPEKGN